MSFKGLLVGVTGLNSQSKKMEVIGNNLANVNTTGYKKSTVTFQELFYDTIKGASSGDGALLGGTNAMTIGGGVGMASITNIFTQGSREATGRTLDFMIDGEDFFVSRNAGDGSLMLTRNGSFQLDADMNLVDSLGNKVQGFNVNRETGAIAAEAGNIVLQSGSIDPNATTLVDLEANIDSSVTKSLATSETNSWEIFSGGENFGAMTVSVPGGSGARDTYGSGYYQDNHLYHDDSAALNAGLDVVTLNAAPAGLIDGFAVGDTVNVVQGSEQVQRTITAINAATREITLNAAAPATFAAGATEITNLSDATASIGTSGSALVHNDVLKSQISMVDADGKLIASFYRVTGPAEQYTRSRANVAGGSEITVGVGEFTSMQELKDLMELALRDTQLSHHAASSDLDLSIDKFGKVTFGGTGLVQEFRLVMNADNSEMLDRFEGIAMTDNAAVATTQARVDASGQIMAAPALGLAARTVHGSKWWFNTTGLETYGYSATNAATEYGEFAGLRFDGGATGSGFGIVQISSENALGQTVTSEFTMVPRDADPNGNEFSTLGELAKLIQNTLRTEEFSSIASDGTLVSDNTVSVSFTNGRLNVSTSNGVFKDLKVTPVNTAADPASGVTRSDYTNFGTVLGELASGVNGKMGSSNLFIDADARVQTKVYDSQGNEHNMTQYFVRDRSSGLTNIEWKFKTGLNPNLNSFASADKSQSIYANTFNSIQDSEGSRGVLAFDITSGEVLGATSGADSRYVNEANLTFRPATDSQEANVADVTIDFSKLTSYNGQNTVIGTNIDGYGMGSLVRVVTEENTGNINGVYSNGKIRTLAKIGLMSISNPEGLQKIGSSYYSQTPNANTGGNSKGIDQIFAVGAQSPASSDSVTSKIHGGALEASNVDLTEELTDMIITQRSFSASGKIITTTDDMLQEALNLKR